MVSSGLHFTQFSFMWFIYNRKKQNNALPFTFFCVLHYIIKLNKIVSIPFQNWKYVQMIVGNWKMRRIHNTPSKRMQNKNILRQNFTIWQPRYAFLQLCVLPFEKPLLIHSETKQVTILVSESLNHSLNRFVFKNSDSFGNKTTTCCTYCRHTAAMLWIYLENFQWWCVKVYVT